jgi:methyl-accepting chemotaxis protein
MTLLAQIDPGTVEPWLKVFFWLVGGVAACVLLAGRITGRSERQTITNEPLKVQAHPGSVSQDELKQVHGRIQRERQEIEAQIGRVAALAEKRSDRLEEKIDQNTAMTSEMRGEMKAMTQSVQNLSSSVTQFLQNEAKRNRA